MIHKTFTGAIDVLTDGVWGTPFAIGAVFYDGTGGQSRCFFALLRPLGVTDVYAKSNVPALAGEGWTHATYESMLASFALWYEEHNKDCRWIKRGSGDKEAFLFRELLRLGCIDADDVPVPFVDVAAMLRASGFGATSQPVLTADGVEDTLVEDYAALRKIDIGTRVPSVRQHPVHICAVTAGVYFDLVPRFPRDLSK